MKLAQGNPGECDADEVLNEGEEVEIDDNKNLKVSGEYLVSAEFKFTFQCCKHSTSTPTSPLFTTIVITIIHLSIVLICLPLMPVIWCFLFFSLCFSPFYVGLFLVTGYHALPIASGHATETSYEVSGYTDP